MDKIDRLVEELAKFVTDRFYDLNNNGYFVSMRLSFIFGLNITKHKVEKEDRAKSSRYISIENLSELKCLVKELDIYKGKSFEDRIAFFQKSENITFPIYLELAIARDKQILEY